MFTRSVVVLGLAYSLVAAQDIDCNPSTNTRRRSSPSRVLDEPTFRTFGECCNECYVADNCRAWSFDEDSGNCLLLSIEGTESTQRGWQSGLGEDIQVVSGDASGDGDCTDDTSWRSSRGNCETYGPGGRNEGHCDDESRDEDDDTTADEACCVSCGGEQEPTGDGSGGSDGGASDNGDFGPLDCDTPRGCEGIYDCSVDELNSMLFKVELSSASSSKLYAEWELCDGATNEIPKLRSPAHSRDAAYIMRLLPGKEYVFQIFEEGSDDLVAQGLFRVGQPPDDVLGREVEWLRGTEGDSTRRMFVSPRNRPPYWQMFDKFGNNLWWIEQEGMPSNGGFGRKDNGNIYFMQDFIGGVLEITPWGEVVHDIVTKCQILHHSITASHGGDKIWSIGKSRYAYQGMDEDQAIDNVVMIDLETGDWSIEIDLADYFNPVSFRTDSSDRESVASELIGCDNKGGVVQDWAHINGIHVNDDGNFVTLTSRNLDAIWGFRKRQSGWNLEWQLGGQQSDFQFENRNDTFYGAHGAVRLDNGNILLFDNGKSRPRDEGGFYSRSIEYELDESTDEARVVWEYGLTQTERSPEGCGSGHRGTLQRLSNGNTYSIYTDCPGHPDGEVGFIVEVDSSERLVSLVQQDVDSDGTFLLDFKAFDHIFGEVEI